MSHYGKHKQLLFARPDSRASVSSSGSGIGGGRFTNALSAALKRENYSRPPLPPTATVVQPKSDSPEEQLEEIEQKITLTLQSIDANFDHCQRTMARDVMPKIEKLAKLSSELLEASQPWLQFFMAVAAADEQVDDDDDGGAGASNGNPGAYTHDQGYYENGMVENDETHQMPLALAQRVALEEQAHKGDITARFPNEATAYGARANGAADDDNESVIDIDAEIDTPQLTSRFMTEELRIGSARKTSNNTKHESDMYPSTPRVRNLKRMAEQLSVSAKKRRLGTPGKEARYESGTPRTPLSMMRALVNPKSSARSSRYGGGPPGSAISFASNNTSSMGTVDLMPDTSPPHTTTFVLPKSRRIAPARGIGKVPASTGGKRRPGQAEHEGSMGNDGEEEDDDDDDILDEINTLIKRYDSPNNPQAAPVSAATSRRSASVRSRSVAQPPVSIAKSDVAPSVSDHMDESEMNALANKYASPTTEPRPEEVAQVKNLVADMEELLDEVEAISDADKRIAAGDDAVPIKKEAVEVSSGEVEAADALDEDRDVLDDFEDDIPSPPKITTDLERPPVSVAELTSNSGIHGIERVQTTTAQAVPVPAVAAPTAAAAAVGGGVPARAVGAAARVAGIQPRRTFGAGRNMIRMDIEEMDNENMTIGHMSPLALRSRQAMLARNQSNNNQPTATTTPPPPAQATTSTAASRFHALDPSGAFDEDDPFGPTPERNNVRPAAQHSTNGIGNHHRLAPSSVQSDQQGGNAAYPLSTRSWSSHQGLESTREQPTQEVISAERTSRSNTAVLGPDATSTYDTPGVGMVGGGAAERGMQTADSQLNESSITIEHNDFESFNHASSIDGTTTILPTREMLQRAAQVAEGSVDHNQSDPEDSRDLEPMEQAMSRRHSVMDEDEEDVTRNSAMSVTASSFSEAGAPLVTTFSADMFPPAFREPPASLQLSALYELVKAQDQRIWALDDIVAAAGESGAQALQGANASMFSVLLDLLSRRRLIRKITDSLWSAH
ncbi:DASH complex subunit ask1 [Coemansia sp. RSA 1939]|nr:DASH complex subunit ask1 [Coemansia sp. RSA 1939]KAJ2607421.1 DASH complex subunit ask1 [Coemansia sp. RSA 1804]